MNIKILNEEAIMANLEQYHASRRTVRKRNRRIMASFFVILLFLYFYLRLFNTWISREGAVIYSTAWIVNCPAPENGRIQMRSYKWYPHLRVLNLEEGVRGFQTDFFAFSSSTNREPDINGSFRLHTVRLPSTLEDLSYSAFAYCTSLEKVIWDKACGSAVIDPFAFYHTGIKEIALPDGVVEIGYCAFGDNENLVRATLPDSVEIMGTDLFMNCINLQEAVWSGSMEEIPEETFLGCKKLTELKNVSGVKRIAYDALTGTQITREMVPVDFTGREDIQGGGL